MGTGGKKGGGLNGWSAAKLGLRLGIGAAEEGVNIRSLSTCFPDQSVGFQEVAAGVSHLNGTSVVQTLYIINSNVLEGCY